MKNTQLASRSCLPPWAGVGLLLVLFSIALAHADTRQAPSFSKDSNKKLGGMEGPTSFRERQMEQRQGNEHVLHIFVSNQSIAMAVADIEVNIDEQQIFHREMTTGTQHNWGEVTIPVVGGEHMVVITEAKTRTRTSETINVDRELWIVIRFSSPPAEFKMDVFDHPVAFM
jgi:hypothetical protein